MKLIIKCGKCDGYLGNPQGAKYQDEKYGQNMRVGNPITKDPKGTWYRCVICGNEVAKGEAEKPSKKKKGA